MLKSIAVAALSLVLWTHLPVRAQQFYWVANTNETIMITGYNGPGAVVVPSTIANLPVTSIGSSAFEGNASITSVMTGTNVTSIGNRAFYRCGSLTNVIFGDQTTNIGATAFCTSGLTSVSIPDTVTAVGQEAFEGCHTLGSVTIGNGVVSISDWAFNGSGVTNVTFGKRVAYIGQMAFYQCGLSSVVFPSSLNSIGDQAFQGCGLLTAFYFEGDAPALGLSALDSEASTVYYLPGRTGFGLVFGNRAALLWNPRMQVGGVQALQFVSTVTGTPGIPILIEACTNVLNATWTPMQTCTLTNGSICFSDARWTNYPSRLYRIRSP
jgi:hypothetical protein